MGRGSAPASRSSAAAAETGPSAPSARGSRKASTGSAGSRAVPRQRPPARVAVDEPAADAVAAAQQGRGDGAARDEGDLVLGRGPAEEDADVGRWQGHERAGCWAREWSSLLRAPAARHARRASRPRTRPRRRSSMPRSDRTTAWTSSASRRTSAALALPVLTMKLACFGLTMAPPTRRPLSPSSSMRRPAESPSGLRKTLPADFWPMGWWAWRQRRMSSSRAVMAAGSAGSRSKTAETTTSGTARRAVLQARLPIGHAQVAGPQRGLAAVGGDDERLAQDGAHVRAVRAGVGPHRAADAARDGQAELETGQPRLARQRWRPWPSAARPPR